MEQIIRYLTSIGVDLQSAVQMAHNLVPMSQQSPGPEYTDQYKNFQPTNPNAGAAEDNFKLNVDGQAGTGVPMNYKTEPRKSNLNAQGIDYNEAQTAMAQHLADRYKMKPAEAQAFAHTMLTSNDANAQAMRNDALKHLVPASQPQTMLAKGN